MSLDDAGVVRLALRWTADLLWEDTDWFGWCWPEYEPVPVVREWVERFAAASPARGSIPALGWG
ncbi:hypothetical protein Lesp02_81460 [Lentzea sp. NBRC 105346]|uniref:hypothetical protein n=1 Tax=Lentzea sp. NBRC 105346 TaxID=3032205 RepID=UPI0024A36599|nr:hypothetical protein [Lentzea sp. NBRC 105346]GLZ35959.1 hypothetical protein Lesp02_81460 [Lentzea sp. NBRC 105346]